MSPHRHLSYQDRLLIQTDLTSKTPFREIALHLAKDPTTIEYSDFIAQRIQQ